MWTDARVPTGVAPECLEDMEATADGVDLVWREERELRTRAQVVAGGTRKMGVRELTEGRVPAGGMGLERFPVDGAL